jgi:hypothetical protein
LEFVPRIAWNPSHAAGSGQAGKGDKLGSYQWFETQDPIAYHADFQKAEDHLSEHDEVPAVLLDKRSFFWQPKMAFILTSEPNLWPI